MLQNYLEEHGIRVEEVVAVEDGKSWAKSVDNLLERCGSFDVLFTGKKTIAKLLGDKVKVVGFERKGKVSSTLIRTSIAKGKN